MCPRNFCHAAGGGMEMRINPGVALVQPNSEISVLPPARGGRRDRLLRRVARQKFRWRRQLETLPAISALAGEPEVLVIVRSFANEQLKESWPLEPPMTEQLGVERCDDNRIKVQRAEFA